MQSNLGRGAGFGLQALEGSARRQNHLHCGVGPPVSLELAVLQVRKHQWWLAGRERNYHRSADRRITAVVADGNADGSRPSGAGWGEENPGNPYVVFNDLPKLEKLKKQFGPMLKK